MNHTYTPDRSLTTNPSWRLARVLPLLTLWMLPCLAWGQNPEPAPTAAPNLEAYEALRQRVQQNAAGATEQEVTQLLEMGRQVGRPFATHVATRAYLARRTDASPALMLAAARAAAWAGDFRTASARYKAYFKAASPSAESSQALAELLQISNDFLANRDDAYQIMKDQAPAHRQSLEVRRFDPLFLAEALQRKDYPAAAERLVLVFNDKLPLEQERLCFWDSLDQLLASLSWANAPEHFNALPALRKLVPLIREDRRRTLRAQMYLANLEHFAAVAEGMEKTALDKNFQKVADAARAYLDAYPQPETLIDIYAMYFGGLGNFSGRMNEYLPVKGATLVHAWGKLNDDQRGQFLTWVCSFSPTWAIYLATPEQWLAIAPQGGAALKTSPLAYHIPWSGRTTPLANYAAALPALDAAPAYTGQGAAVARSLAQAKPNDLWPAIDHLAQRESWHLGFTDVYSLAINQLWQAFANQTRPADQPLPPDYYERMAYRFLSTHVPSSPLAMMDAIAARDYVTYSYRYSGANAQDKSKVAAALAALAWVPFTEQERQGVFNPAYGEFKRWAESVRQEDAQLRRPLQQTTRKIEPLKKELADLEKSLQETRAQSKPTAAIEAKIKQTNEQIAALTKELEQQQNAVKQSDARLAQIAPLDAAFKTALANPGDIAKAPTPLTRLLAQAAVAARQRNQAEYLSAVRQAYKLVREYDTQRVPYGQAVMEYLLASRAPAFDVLDWQCEVLKDQLTLLQPADPLAPRPSLVIQAIVRSRNWSTIWHIPTAESAQGRKLHAVLSPALAELLAKNQFSIPLFNWFRATRRGINWADQSLSADVLDRMIQQKTLYTANYRILPGPITYSYVYLVYNEFQILQNKYPVAGWFDDLYLQEFTAGDHFHWIYWNYSNDPSLKIRNAAAAHFARQQTMPLGYGQDRPVYSRTDYVNWMSSLLQAGAEQRNAAVTAIEATYGKTRYDAYARGLTFFMLYGDAPPTPAARKEYFAKLSAYLQKQSTLPQREGPPRLTALGKLDARSLSPEELATLLSIFQQALPNQWQANWGAEGLAALVQDRLLADRQEAQLIVLLPHLWRIARDLRSSELSRQLAAKARELFTQGQEDLAAVQAAVGLEILNSESPEDVRSLLMSLRSQATAKLGGSVAIPRSDPRYPIFAAQLDYQLGKTDSAWQQYQNHRNLLTTSLKELDPAFVTWLVQRTTEARQYEQAEELGRQLIQWMDSLPSGFEPETRAAVLLAYADIAMARQEYPRARAQYERVASAREFEGTQPRRDAELKIAEVDRRTKAYDRAIARLEKLIQGQDRYLRTEAHYLMAMIQFDREEYPQARESLDQVFQRNPSHPDGRILEGKLLLQLKKLVEATQLKVGLSSEQRFLVPGRPLKVDLEDRNLATVGSSAQIQVRAWTASGDQETFNLLPFGDSKTHFEGQVPTELGAPRPGDRILQVRGNDKVSYSLVGGLSDAKSPEQVITLSVISDAQLFASSGKILTAEELQERALDKLVRQRLRLEVQDDKQMLLSAVRAEDQIKPGNPIHLRVIDPSRSVSDKPDTVTVKLATSSGDLIAAFPLTETGPHTGIFEGSVPTATADATAYASDSDEGRSPNYAISRNDLPPWVGLPDNQRPKFFSVDLNANVPLGKLTIAANVPGRKLKEFLLQKSLNGKDFQTVASFPKPYAPWDGALQLEMVKYAGNQPPRTISEFENYLEWTYLSRGLPKVTLTPKDLRSRWDSNLLGQADTMKMQWNDWYIAHYRGAFHLARQQQRTFKLALDRPLQQAVVLMALDGQTNAAQPHTVSSLLKPGVHRLDIYIAAFRPATAPSFSVMTDINEPPFQALVTAAMFDPAKNPQVKREIGVEAATVTPSKDAGEFQIQFARDTNTRILRLVLTDFETDAPAIQRLTLTDDKGKAVLPVQRDFQALRNNQVLEIVPGDHISISYQNPRVLTKGREIQEASLSATFTDAQISACFVDYRRDAQGNRVPEYIPMRRFKVGDRVNVFLRDADSDVSDKKDTIPFTVAAGSGQPITLQALETEEHSGLFVGSIFPVAGTPEKVGQVKVAPGQDLLLTYLDKENTNPGIAWDRTYTVEQVTDAPPQLRVYPVESQPLSPEQIKAHQAAAANAAGGRRLEEQVPVTRTLVATRPAAPTPANPPTPVILGGPLLVELTYPALAQSPRSIGSLYAQTSSGLKKAGIQPADGQFDINVPGTIRLDRTPGDSTHIVTPPGYAAVNLRRDPYAGDPLDDGRFTYLVPVELGVTPDQSLVDQTPTVQQPSLEQPSLLVNGQDVIYLGFRYTDAQGQDKWITRQIKLQGDLFLDVMDRRYQDALEGVQVGEVIYLRLVAPTLSVSDERNAVKLQVATKPENTRTVELTETLRHSGVFKGQVPLSYAGDKAPAQNPLALPVNYGDKIVINFKPSETAEAIQRTLAVHQGADGQVIPFTKRFKDPAMAVQTQFTIAEAYFELAKRHRELKEDQLARQEIAQGKKLLEEALRDYPDSEYRAQAEYLLANLASEFAKDATQPDIRRQHHMEALTRFSDIVSSYPDSAYAPKAQFKKALVLEQMGQIDQACEEYVKLAYRYPDNELVAETISRLGQYFLTKGKEFDDKAQAQNDMVEKEKILIQSREMYKTAAQVFGRLAERFPNHPLAAKSTAVAGQCYMRAQEYDKAIDQFRKVYENAKTDNELAAETMYWAADCYVRKNDLINAYRGFKKLTWDYPESVWAKYARGRLTEDALARIGEQDTGIKH